jgi:NAD(P)-dependent dehydrogenase (short-subunit alcohol dehydrogenase family)
MNFHAARVVVTGGASGIGRALALRAASEGAHVAVVDLQTEAAERVAEEIRASGGLANAFTCDVAIPEQVDGLAQAVRTMLGGVDVMFNNAGVGVAGKVEDLSSVDAAWVIAVNLSGLINGARAFVPLLRESAAAGREAWIVNTGSEHSLGIPNVGASNVYTATKHAALGLTDALRSDLEGSGVRAALLCPGLTNTNIYQAKSMRPAVHGGHVPLPDEHRARAQTFLAKGQDPALTAELTFEGLARGDFLIITDPHVGSFVRPRLAEIERAIVQVETRLGSV